MLSKIERNKTIYKTAVDYFNNNYLFKDNYKVINFFVKNNYNFHKHEKIGKYFDINSLLDDTDIKNIVNIIMTISYNDFEYSFYVFGPNDIEVLKTNITNMSDLTKGYICKAVEIMEISNDLFENFDVYFKLQMI